MKLVGKMKKKGEKTFFANFTSYKSPTNKYNFSIDLILVLDQKWKTIVMIDARRREKIRKKKAPPLNKKIAKLKDILVQNSFITLKKKIC